jgi:hypothetical protein
LFLALSSCLGEASPAPEAELTIVNRSDRPCYVHVVWYEPGAKVIGAEGGGVWHHEGSFEVEAGKSKPYKHRGEGGIFVRIVDKDNNDFVIKDSTGTKSYLLPPGARYEYFVSPDEKNHWGQLLPEGSNQEVRFWEGNFDDVRIQYRFGLFKFHLVPGDRKLFIEH